MSEGIPIAIQLDIAERLRADEYFTVIKVLGEDKEDITSETEAALGPLNEQGGKTGICAIVQQPIGTDEFANVTGGPVELDIVVLILENRVVNKDTTNGGTGKMAWDVAKRVLKLLKNYRATGLCRGLNAKTPTIVPSDAFPGAVAYEVRFQTSEADSNLDTRVVDVVISPASGAAPQTVTLTCATAGASIYYTLDGTHPWSGNAAAVLYSAPFNVATPKTLRCCAFKTGSIASNVNRAQYT